MPTMIASDTEAFRSALRVRPVFHWIFKPEGYSTNLDSKRDFCLRIRKAKSSSTPLPLSS